jgi:hypothetical protein
MKKKLKLMETSASDTRKMSQLRHAEMSRANDIQERLVNMDIMSKDLSTCVNEYERAYFRKAKEKILNDLDNPPARVQSEAPSQLENSSLALSQLGDTENRQSSLLGDSESQESREEDEEVDEEDFERDENIHGACDETDLNLSIEPSFFL